MPAGHPIWPVLSSLQLASSIPNLQGLSPLAGPAETPPNICGILFVFALWSDTDAFGCSSYGTPAQHNTEIATFYEPYHPTDENPTFGFKKSF